MPTNDPWSSNSLAGSEIARRGEREEALAAKQMAKREARDSSYDGVTERQPSLITRIKRLLKK